MKKYTIYFVCLLCIFSSCVNTVTSEDADIKITIYGTVSDAETGEPLNNVAVSAINADGLGGTAGKSVTGTDGTYEMIVNTSNFTNTIRAEKTKYETTETKVETTGSWEKDQKYKVDIQMHKEAVIYQGIVKDKNGNRLENAKINVSFNSYSQEVATAFTDSYGEYMVEVPRIVEEDNPITNWTNHIIVSKTGYVSQSQSLSHTASDLGKTYTVNFEMATK